MTDRPLIQEQRNWLITYYYQNHVTSERFYGTREAAEREATEMAIQTNDVPMTLISEIRS